MIITAIVTVMVTVMISTAARYVTWQLSVLGHPLYMFLLWHVALFAIVLFLFYDRRHGFEKSIGFLGHVSLWHRLKSHEGKVNATMAVYKEHATKFSTRDILLPVAIVLFVAYILSSHMLFFAIVTSGSMEPTFKKGDLVFMQDVLVKPKVGDIIIYPDPQRYKIADRPITITHRIAKISGNTIRTKGDNNPFPDSWSIDKRTVLGEAVTFNNKPIVLKDVGKYFLLDFESQQYTAEFLAIAKTIQNFRSMGIMVFFMCLILYIALSIGESRAVKQFKYR